MFPRARIVIGGQRAIAQIVTGLTEIRPCCANTLTFKITISIDVYG
jgi:hypothetical protein